MDDRTTAIASSPVQRLDELKSAALDAAANAIIITDCAGIVVWVNPAFHKLTGYSSEEVVGNNINLLKSGVQPVSFYKALWQTILAGDTWQGHIVDKRKDGSLYDENMTIAPLRNAQGAITHFVAVKQDRDKQDRGDERSTMLAQAVQNSSDLIGISNRAGEFIFVNEALLKITGYSSQAIIGKHFGMILSPNNPSSVLEGIGVQGLESGGWHGEVLVRRRDQTDFISFLNVGPVRDIEGRVTGMLGIGHDITQRKKVEEALRASEEQFRQLAENIHEVFFVVQTEPARMLYLSPAYEEIWGRSRQEVYDRPAAWIDSVYPEDREHVGRFFAQSMQGVQTEMSYRILRPDGSLRWIDARGFPVRDEQGRFVRVVGIAEDSTTRRETHEKLSSAMAELKEQTRDAAKLAELVDILQSCQSVDEALGITGNVLQGILQSTAGGLFITSPSRDTVELAASWGDIRGTEKVFRLDDCWALRRGKLHRVQNPDSPLRCAHINKSAGNESLCVPLMAQGETLGVMHVENISDSVGSSAATATDRGEVLERQARAVGERISLALANLRLREVLRSQSIRDPLTGLFNRRFMEESLERELRRAMRGGQQVALLMLDIDHFKQFNDTFGHQAGDAVLRALGNLLKETTRGQDVVCRYGGEEFAFVLSGASREAARRRAEVVREEVKSLNVRHGGQLLGAVTLSVGIAVFPENGETAERLVKAADDALYRAKEEGRDRIASAQALDQLR